MPGCWGADSRRRLQDLALGGIGCRCAAISSGLPETQASNCGCFDIASRAVLPLRLIRLAFISAATAATRSAAGSAREGRSLTRPLGAEARFADGLTCGVERLSRVVGNRIGRDLMSGKRGRCTTKSAQSSPARDSGPYSFVSLNYIRIPGAALIQAAECVDSSLNPGYPRFSQSYPIENYQHTY